MAREAFFTVLSESELNDLLAGRWSGGGLPWFQSDKARVPAGLTGVLWHEGARRDQPATPVALVSREEDQKRLCARFAQLRSDLSPLSVWCHLLTPERLDGVRELTRDADLGGFEAAWAGVVVAEALLLAERSVGKLRLAACLATQSFSIARTAALWSKVPHTEVLERFDRAQVLFRLGDAKLGRLRDAFWPVWATLAGAAEPSFMDDDGELRPLIHAVRGLNEARSRKSDDESYHLIEPLAFLVPECDIFLDIDKKTAERRLKDFDTLVNILSQNSTRRDKRRRNALAMLAGYMATIAAGGAPSLALAESHARNWPEITAWAYALGGVGERVVWTSSFDGLGRLIARELLRPFRFDEPPLCDIGLEEAQVLVDPQLSDPLVHLRLKQARVASVALLPGVNLAVALGGEPTGPEPRRPDSNHDMATRQKLGTKGDHALGALADALWPYLAERLGGSDVPHGAKEGRGRQRGRSGSQTGLPLRGGGNK